MKRPSSRLSGRIHFVTARGRTEGALCMGYKAKVRITAIREEVTCRRCWAIMAGAPRVIYEGRAV